MYEIARVKRYLAESPPALALSHQDAFDQYAFDTCLPLQSARKRADKDIRTKKQPGCTVYHLRRAYPITRLHSRIHNLLLSFPIYYYLRVDLLRIKEKKKKFLKVDRKTRIPCTQTSSHWISLVGSIQKDKKEKM